MLIMMRLEQINQCVAKLREGYHFERVEEEDTIDREVCAPLPSIHKSIHTESGVGRDRLAGEQKARSPS